MSLFTISVAREWLCEVNSNVVVALRYLPFIKFHRHPHASAHSEHNIGRDVRVDFTFYLLVVERIYEHENKLFASQMKSINETLEAHKEMR